MDETNRRLRQARERAGFKSSRSAAIRHHWVPSTYGSHENGQTPVPRSAAKEYAKAFNVTVAWLLNLQSSPNEPPPLPTPDGEKINVDQLEPHRAKVLHAAIAGRQAEVWRVTEDVLAGAGYQMGDFLIVDLEATPKSRDFVLAEQQGIPIFRLYLRPYLYYLPLAGQPAPTTVDHVQTILKGVIVSKLSI